MKTTKGIPVNSLPAACLKLNPFLLSPRTEIPFPPTKKGYVCGVLNLKVETTAKKSPLAVKFENLWSILGGPDLETECKFHPTRRWRLDYYHPPSRIGIELEGGIFLPKSGHSSINGIKRDIEKGNALALLGIHCFRLHAGMIKEETLREIIGRVKHSNS